MNRFLAMSAVAALIALSILVPNASAATDKQARQCGTAVATLYVRYMYDLHSRLREVCRDPSRLALEAKRATAKANKQIERLNQTYSDATCDPDAAGLFPIAELEAPSVENLMETISFGGATLAELCDNEGATTTLE